MSDITEPKFEYEAYDRNGEVWITDKDLSLMSLKVFVDGEMLTKLYKGEIMAVLITGDME